MDINSALTAAMTQKRFWVYTDGSAETLGNCSGSWAAMIITPDGKRQYSTGAAIWTTVNRMELTALLSALDFIKRIALRGVALGEAVQVFSDSTYVVNGATGKNKRGENRDLWAQFDEAMRGLEVSIEWVERNKEPEQAMADAMCDHVRALLKDFLVKMEATEDFQSLNFRRATEVNPRQPPKPKLKVKKDLSVPAPTLEPAPATTPIDESSTPRNGRADDPQTDPA